MPTISLDTAAYLRIVAKENDDFTLVHEMRTEIPFSWAGYVLTMIVKKARSESLPPILTFASNVTPATISLITGNGIPGNANQYSKYVLTQTKSVMTDVSGKYVYDLWATKDGITKTWQSGDFLINAKAYW